MWISTQNRQLRKLWGKDKENMERKLYKDLAEWESMSVKEPLMLIGVRQVGKTWLIQKFCEDCYTDTFYVNLEEQQSFQSAFDGDLSPTVILRNLSILAGRTLTESTTIVLDEIQVCERAITALKYFCEAKENYRVIAAGSLLGVKINRFSSSFPVGKVRIVHMYPLDFEEFLVACGESLLRDAVRQSFRENQVLPTGIHEKALLLCYDYMLVGGMPKAVSDYVACGKRITAFRREIHRELQLAYLSDMTKYVSSPYETEKISQVYQSVPRQLAKENPKFKYSVVRPNANKRDFYAPIDWLKSAGMVLSVNALEVPLSPLKSYTKEGIFKLYLSDVGMLSSMCGMKPRDLLPEENNMYKGAVAENYVIQQFAAHREALYYFKPSENMEIDLVDDSAAVIPIEIKAGRHKRSRSLDRYMEHYKPEEAIRISALNFGKTGTLLSVPLYAVFCLADNGQ